MLQAPEPLELPAVSEKETAMPLEPNEADKGDSLPAARLKYPDEIFPKSTQDMLWEEPLENSTSAWFGQPTPRVMELAKQLDAAVAAIDEVKVTGSPPEPSFLAHVQSAQPPDGLESVVDGLNKQESQHQNATLLRVAKQPQPTTMR